MVVRLHEKQKTEGERGKKLKPSLKFTIIMQKIEGKPPTEKEPTEGEINGQWK